ncbi:MAG: purine-nucleoside phosphorylase [Thermodesulfobacteriota bacterium]
MNQLYEQVVQSAEALRARTALRPKAAIVLGTGLGAVTDGLDTSARIPYAEAPFFPQSTVEGHKGELLFGTLGGCEVAVMQGRFHLYEGYSAAQVTFPVRVLRELGVGILAINSAAGGLNPLFKPTDVMVVTDHLNFMGEDPLRGLTDPRLGDRFPDMSRPYDHALVAMAQKAALDLKIPMQSGTYLAVRGPSLETRAETRMLRMLGADAVGMSTVPEVIVAASIGLRTLAFAAITNVNLPDCMEPVSLDKVIQTARLAAPKIGAILQEVLGNV